MAMEGSLTTASLMEELRRQKPFLRERFHVHEIGVFGSFARGEATEKSDIDFLVTIVAPVEIYRKNKEALNAYLKDLFKRDVDLANPHSLKPHYRERILSQAVYA